MIVLVLLSLFKLASSNAPSISGASRTSVEVELGGDLDISCSVLNAVEFPILWVKLPSPEVCGNETEKDECREVPLTSGSALLVSDPRFRFA